MNILQLHADSPANLKEQLVGLLGLQMQAIGDAKSEEHIRRALDNFLAPAKRTALFVAIHDNADAAAFCVLNICSGIQSGGDYIWINEIFVREDMRRNGYAGQLLRHVEEWAKARDCVYAAGISYRGNHASQAVFARRGFELSEPIWMDKDL